MISPEARRVDDVTEDDPRLLQAMREYQAAVDSGARPSREEFLTKYSDIAGELAECLDGLAALRSAAPALGVITQAPIRDMTGTLGDFRILREIGRGGMGVVYEAEQISLGRRVALKVLSLAATLDPRHRQRFENEARAAAQLHHPNIVPVFAVGTDRGVPYYAMQLIEGRTLAEALAEERGEGPASPAAETAPAAKLTVRSGEAVSRYRAAAELGVQAAEALEYAHGMNVIHRDIKPGNLIVDGRGKLWV